MPMEAVDSGEVIMVLIKIKVCRPCNRCCGLKLMGRFDKLVHLGQIFLTTQ